MKIIIKKTPVEVNLKELLVQLVATYHEANALLEEGVRDANKQFKAKENADMYTPEYLRNSLEKSKKALLDAAMAAAQELNEKAVKSVAALKKMTVSAFVSDEKPSDYAARVSNALQFVQLEGADITDEIAHQILKEFIGDMEIMQRFRSVIEKQKGEKLEDAFGATTFPLTFGRLQNCESYLKALAELEEMTSRLFIRAKAQTETEYYKGVTLSVPMDSLSQLMAERNSIEQAGVVESMAAELFTAAE